MTITQSSEVSVMHRGALHAEHVTADPLTLFLANELFPMMIAYWPASANQLDSNASGAAKAWNMTIKGFPVWLVREAVLHLADDVDRKFAPRPAEVKALMASMMQGAQPTAQTGRTISIRACEMEATVRVYLRVGKADELVTDDAVAAELESILSDKRRAGVTVTGRI